MATQSHRQSGRSNGSSVIPKDHNLQKELEFKDASSWPEDTPGEESSTDIGRLEDEDDRDYIIPTSGMIRSEKNR